MIRKILSCLAILVALSLVQPAHADGALTYRTKEKAVHGLDYEQRVIFELDQIERHTAGIRNSSYKTTKRLIDIRLLLILLLALNLALFVLLIWRRGASSGKDTEQRHTIIKSGD